MVEEEKGREPGNWELYRIMQRIEQRLGDVVTTEVMKLYTEGNDRRHQEAEKRQAAWEAKSEAAHVGLDKKIEALDDKIDERAEADRRAKAGRTLTIAVAALSGVISIVGIVIGAVVR